MLAYSTYRQNAKHSLLLLAMEPKDIDRIIGKNLRRLRDAAGLTQDALADKIGSDGVVIAQFEGSIRGMGKDIMSRLCVVLKVHPWEFYLDDAAPIVSDPIEQECLYMMREAKPLGVAEQVEKYGRFMIEEAKKKSSTPGKDAKPRDKRTRKKAS